MRHAIKAIIATLFCLVFAAGCGQKAPLFLPGDPGTLRTELPGQDADDATADEDEEDKN